jgi:hypothetical protein
LKLLKGKRFGPVMWARESELAADRRVVVGTERATPLDGRPGNALPGHAGQHRLGRVGKRLRRGSLEGNLSGELLAPTACLNEAPRRGTARFLLREGEVIGKVTIFGGGGQHAVLSCYVRGDSPTEPPRAMMPRGKVSREQHLIASQSILRHRLTLRIRRLAFVGL